METLTNISIDEYECKLCNKKYKNKSGIWKHNNKYHKETSIQNHHNDVYQCNQNVYISDDNKEINECKYCKKSLSNRQSRWRHEQKCKQNNKDIIFDLNNKINELQSQLTSFINASKIHPKTLQKINKNLINGNNNTLNSGTVNNNTIQIVKFGYKAIEESIKKVHFNDDRPEYRNIYITNLRDNIAYVYNGNKFEAVQKHSIINQLIDQHMNNIEVSFEDYKDKLPERTIEILDKLIEKLQDEHTSMIDEENNKEFKNYRMFKINEVKLMIYNETGNNTEVIKLKYNNSIFNKPIKEIDV